MSFHLVQNNFVFEKDSRGVHQSTNSTCKRHIFGMVEPDRWLLNRKRGRIISHVPAVRETRVIASERGVASESLPEKLKRRPPLSEEDILNIYRLLLTTEEVFGAAQDMEWTMKDNELYLLQSRPITTTTEEDKEDKRPWYLSLRRSFDNLRLLRGKIEGQILPSMIAAADEMA